MSDILTINGGSSSVRFAIFNAERPPKCLLRGKMERIGTDEARLTVDGGAVFEPVQIDVGNKAQRPAIGFLLDCIERHPLFKSIGGVAHRVVHGMQHTEPALVTDAVLEELKTHHPV